MDDINEPIIAYNLNVNGTCIENVSDKESNYSVTLKKSSPLGGGNQGIITNLEIEVNV